MSNTPPQVPTPSDKANAKAAAKVAYETYVTAAYEAYVTAIITAHNAATAAKTAAYAAYEYEAAAETKATYDAGEYEWGHLHLLC